MIKKNLQNSIKNKNYLKNTTPKIKYRKVKY